MGHIGSSQLACPTRRFPNYIEWCNIKSMRPLWQFICSVSKHWGALVTGGVIIGALGIWQSTEHIVKPWVYWIVAIAAAFIACFKAWEDQFNAAQYEKAMNLRPHLAGEVLYAKLGGTTTGSVMGEPQPPSTLLLLKLGLTNKNNVDTTIKDVGLILEKDDKQYQCTREDPMWGSLVIGYHDQFGGHQEVPRVSLMGNITYENPIRYRVRSEGWLQFRVVGMADQKQPIRADMTITVIDELEDSHLIRIKSQLIQA